MPDHENEKTHNQYQQFNISTYKKRKQKACIQFNQNKPNKRMTESAKREN